MIRRLCGLGVAAALLLAPLPGSPPARAETPGDHLVGLFLQGCLPFVGDVAGLRAWAEKARLAKLPAGGQAAFLQGQPGIAFDATDPGGKLVLISDDGGSCSAIAERIDPALVLQLERALTRLGVGLSVVADQDDPQEKVLHYREYVARKGNRTWRIVVSTGKPDSGAHPMLTALPE